MQIHHLFTLTVGLALSLSQGALARDIGEGNLYRLHLTDKAGSTYCELTERAMQRRERQGIALDEADVNVSPVYLAELTAQGWHVVTRSRWLNTVVVEREDGSDQDMNQLAALPFVARVEQIHFAADDPLANVQKPNLAVRKNKWQTGEEDDTAYETEDYTKPVMEVRGDVLHQVGFRGEGMLIAVLDGGWMRLPRWDFLMDKVVGWYDCYAPDDATGEAFFAASDHGTQVLSCMATDSEHGVWGTAPDARYFLVRTEFVDTETPLEEDMWVFGAEMADSLGADLINSSLGYTDFDNADFDHKWDDFGQNVTQVSRGASMACQKGILVCNSAGNDRMNPWQKISFPADVSDVLTIGAMTPNLSPADFTSVGWTASGVKPDVACRGAQSWIINAVTGRPTRGSGTSYASPLICGLMASLWGANLSLKPAELCQIVRESASQYAAPDSLLGYGMPDFAAALAKVNPEAAALAIQPTLCDRSASARETRICDLYGRQCQGVGQEGLYVIGNERKMLIIR